MILAGAHAGPKQLARFRAEAEAVARLQHPNIVQIYEVGEHDGLPYFALEFVDGGSLADADRPRPAAPAARRPRVGRELARADRSTPTSTGIVHRDLKPANVLLDRRRGRPRSPTSAWPSGSTTEAAARRTTGAIARHAQLHGPGAGRAGDTRRSARPPTCTPSGPSSTSCSPAGRRSAATTPAGHARAGPDPRAGAARAARTRRCPRDLETICLKCLQKDPAKRYAHAPATWPTTCGRFLAGQPILARPVGGGRAGLAVVPAEPADRRAGGGRRPLPGRRDGRVVGPGCRHGPRAEPEGGRAGAGGRGPRWPTTAGPRPRRPGWRPSGTPRKSSSRASWPCGRSAP